MDALNLPLPPEPLALRTLARTLLEQAPAEGAALIAGGDWLAEPLWASWGAALERRGLDRAAFTQIVIGYGNEARLWVLGERPWEHCASGLAGRVGRRLPAVVGRSAPLDESQPVEANGEWRPLLARVGLSPEATEERLTAAIDRLHLLREVTTELAPAGGGRRAFHRAVVWEGATPRDPEVPFGVGESLRSRGEALAAALAAFLRKDPAYPVG